MLLVGPEGSWHAVPGSMMFSFFKWKRRLDSSEDNDHQSQLLVCDGHTFPMELLVTELIRARGMGCNDRGGGRTPD